MNGAPSRFEVLTGLSGRSVLLVLGLMLALLAAGLWLASQFVHPIPPRQVTFATGPEHGTLHALGLRYKEILARDGIDVNVIATRGTAENLELLRRADARVDVAFLTAGLATGERAAGLVNVANVFYAPLWLLYRDPRDLTELAELKDRRIAIGESGSGVTAAVVPLLAANGVDADSARLVRGPADDALAQLRAGAVDVVLTGEGPPRRAFVEALADPNVKLMSFTRADAYARRFPHLHSLTLPAGTLDFARDLPARDTKLIGTVAMIVGRETLHPTIIDVLTDAARQIHGGNGYFERRGEFPDLAQVDAIRVSEQAIRYARTGPSFLRRYLPLWVADLLQRIITLGLPFLLVLLPAARWVPRAFKSLVQQRIEQRYAALRVVEQRIESAELATSFDELRRELDRIDGDLATLRVPVSFARQLYQLRSHVAMVRTTLLQRSGAETSAPAATV